MRLRCGQGALLLLLAQGCGGGGSLSRSQDAFLSVYGDPIAYTILFADEALGPDGRATTSAPRRVESWMWASRRVLFDNGFFVEERGLPTAIDAEPFASRPDVFVPGMTPDAVRGALGAARQEEEGAVGASSLLVLRYEGPLAVSFLDGEIASVVAGLEVQP